MSEFFILFLSLCFLTHFRLNILEFFFEFICAALHHVVQLDSAFHHRFLNPFIGNKNRGNRAQSNAFPELLAVIRPDS